MSLETVREDEPLSIIIRIAEEKDLLPIQRLVAKAGLDQSGIEQQVKNFLVVENEWREIVGTIGIEQLGNGDGLLRSFVMKSENWNGKIGLEFLEITIAYAKQKNLQKLYLLTNQSIPFFEYLGFSIVEEIPLVIKNSQHFHNYVEGVTKIMCYSLKE